MDAFNLTKLLNEIIRDEGCKQKPYEDTEGILTIGVGWNLEANGLPQPIIDQLLNISINRAIEDAESLFKGFSDLTPARQRVLVNMSFNLGRHRLSGFKKMIKAVDDRNDEEVVVQMLDSRWAKQVGKRAWRLVDMWRDG